MKPVLALLLGLAALGSGPLLAGALARWERLHAALDGFVLCIVAGLCAAVLLPHALASLGPSALPLALLGFAVPLFTERWLSRHRPGETPGVLVVALAGLLVHEALDGAGLAVAGEHGHGDAHGHATTVAILVHRLPVGLLVWWSVEPALGRKATWGVLGVMAAATVGGFLFGHELVASVGTQGAGVLNALLSGALLHVIFDHGPERAHEQHATSSALGALSALVLCGLLLPVHAVPGARAALGTTVGLLDAAGPALLVGLAGAALLASRPGSRPWAGAPLVALLAWALLGARLAVACALAAPLVALAARAVAGRPASGEPPRGALRALLGPLDDLAPWTLVGLLAAGALQPVIDAAWVARLPAPAQAPLAAAAGAALGVGAAPLAAMLVGKGLSGGAAVALVVAGALAHALRMGAWRAGLAVTVAVVAGGAAAGLAVDALGLTAAGAARGAAGPGARVCGVAFLLLCLASLLHQGPRGFLARLGLVHRHGHAPTEPCDPPAAAHEHEHEHHHHPH